MKRALIQAALLAGLASATLVHAQTTASPPTDPIVEQRMNDRQAKRDYRDRVSDAKRQARLDKRVNKEKAAEAGEMGRDPIVAQRMLDRQTNKELRQDKREARAELKSERRDNAKEAAERMQSGQ